jgi:hypothetical protein
MWRAAVLVAVSAACADALLLLPAGKHAISAAPAASCGVQMLFARAPAKKAVKKKAVPKKVVLKKKKAVPKKAVLKKAVPKKAVPKKAGKKAASGPNFQYLNLVPPKNPREEPESIVGLLAQGIEAFADFGLPPPVIAAVVAWILFAAKILLSANSGYDS